MEHKSVRFRTLVRVFLLAGGVAFAVSGALAGSPLEVGFGALAAVLGGTRLWWEYQERRDGT